MVHIAVLSTDHIQRETEMLSTMEQHEAREAHYKEMQKILEIGMLAIRNAENLDDADAARWSARDRIKELNDKFEKSFREK